MFTFQGTPVPTFQLGPRTPPTILKCACDECLLWYVRCAVPACSFHPLSAALCACCAAGQYSGAGVGMCCAVACCATHMINYFRSKCKLCLGTIYCAFQLKTAHFRRFEHNILWWQEKIHTSHKKLYKIIAIFQLIFVLFAHNSANMRCHALCAVLRRRLCVA